MFRLIVALLLATSYSFAQRTVVIAYGDMRFTDPKETQATNPKVRKWLVDKIAAEKPTAIVISGDVPYVGENEADYAEFHLETEPWRAANILVFPAMGNHELRGDPKKCLDNWWREFPQVHEKRWYASEIGPQIVVLTVDSSLPLTIGSEQIKWVEQQLINLRKTARFVIFNLHHPPVADIETGEGASHNPRPNEIAFADYLTTAPQSKRVRFIVNSGHIHNYERFFRDGTVYLVSGGGGAAPVPVKRSADDLYQGAEYPNYHYIKFVLRGRHLNAEMIRVADPSADKPTWEVKDRFEISPPKGR
ncbi:MAG TPA: metallophosphoesterase [Bryobacteraceae bacterium]|nr:metallophosphoesterase [Bryobacteraceae bacterium]